MKQILHKENIQKETLKIEVKTAIETMYKHIFKHSLNLKAYIGLRLLKGPFITVPQGKSIRLLKHQRN